MRLYFSHRANQDIDRLYEFLVTARGGGDIASKAMMAIKDGAQNLLLNPELGRTMDDFSNRREWSVPFGKNAYVLRYIIDYDNRVIHILRIYHSREDR